MDLRVEDPILPPAPQRYDAHSEAEYRAAVQRWMEDVVAALRAIVAELG